MLRTVCLRVLALEGSAIDCVASSGAYSLPAVTRRTTVKTTHRSTSYSLPSARWIKEAERRRTGTAAALRVTVEQREACILSCGLRIRGEKRSKTFWYRSGAWHAL